MMTFKIEPGLLPQTIQVPKSKSYANRALILAALKKAPVRLKQLPLASDVTILLEALKSVGLSIKTERNETVVLNSFPECESPAGASVKVGEGGTTARFLACLLLNGKAPYELILGERLKERPWDEFLTVVKKLGGRAELTGQRLLVQGPLKLPKEFFVDATLTTQFVSGFQLALAFSDTVVRPQSLESSLSYWKMTQKMVQHFKLQDSYTIPADWSSASYPLAFCALKQAGFFPGLFLDEFQADAKLGQILELIGTIKYLPEGIRIVPSTYRGDLRINVQDCLDLVPTLGYLLAHIEGTHSLTGFENLIYKESDRLREVMKLLEQLGVSTQLQMAECRIDPLTLL